MIIYLIGSLRNAAIPSIANEIQAAGFEVFADWYAAGPEADDRWRDYETARGYNYVEALQRPAARNVFQFDKRHLDRAGAAILVLPAGKSGHLELGYAIGQAKKSYVLLDNPDRWDVMYQFADKVTTDLDEIIADLQPKETCDPGHGQQSFDWAV